MANESYEVLHGIGQVPLIDYIYIHIFVCVASNGSMRVASCIASFFQDLTTSWPQGHKDKPDQTCGSVDSR